MVSRRVMVSAVIWSTPSMSGGSSTSLDSGSREVASVATWVATSIAFCTSLLCEMGKSTTATAKPWLELPTRRISPLRTYQTVPLMSRSVVTRRPTASTVPLASPRSTTSPTPYWSSTSMNMPDRKSRTRFCAPKATATPSTPAEASTGAT